MYCDQTTDGGAWMVIQRRYGNLTLDFSRTWREYRNGFGNLTKEFWLGNTFLRRLTSNDYCQLLVELEDVTGMVHNVAYGGFEIDTVKNSYKITVAKETAGTTNSGSIISSHAFSTWDRDNGNQSDKNCALPGAGGWWSSFCHNGSVSGLNTRGKIYWDGVSLPTITSSTMKIRILKGKLSINDRIRKLSCGSDRKRLLQD